VYCHATLLLSLAFLRYFHHNGQRLIKVAGDIEKPVRRLFPFDISVMSPYEASLHPRKDEFLPLRPMVIRLRRFAEIMPVDLQGDYERRALHADYKTMTAVLK